MTRIDPPNIYSPYPCSIVALCCCKGMVNNDIIEFVWKIIRNDGYLSLTKMQLAINEFFKPRLKKYKYYTSADRPRLCRLDFKDKEAIACVEGHYIYIKDNKYYSFFDNNFDKVVAVWYF